MASAGAGLLEGLGRTLVAQLESDRADMLRRADERMRQSDRIYAAGRDAAADERWERQFKYRQGRDAVADERYDDEFEYRKGRDRVGDERWWEDFHLRESTALDNQEYQRDLFEYRKKRDTIGDKRYDEQFEYRKGRDRVGDERWWEDFHLRESQALDNQEYQQNLFEHRKDQARIGNKLDRDRFDEQKRQNKAQREYWNRPKTSSSRSPSRTSSQIERYILGDPDNNVLGLAGKTARTIVENWQVGWGLDKQVVWKDPNGGGMSRVFSQQGARVMRDLAEQYGGDRDAAATELPFVFEQMWRAEKDQFLKKAKEWFPDTTPQRAYDMMYAEFKRGALGNQSTAPAFNKDTEDSMFDDVDKQKQAGQSREKGWSNPVSEARQKSHSAMPKGVPSVSPKSDGRTMGDDLSDWWNLENEEDPDIARMRERYQRRYQ